MTEGEVLLKRFERALEKFHGAYADAYADAEDRGDAKRTLNDAREALLAALARTVQPICAKPDLNPCDCRGVCKRAEPC